MPNLAHLPTLQKGGKILRKLTLDDIHKYSAVGDLQFSPDGKHFVFVQKEINVRKNNYLSNIWYGDITRGSVSQFTRGDGDSSPVISPDGKKMVFSSKRNSETKGSELYLSSLEGGESRFIKVLKGGFSSVSWIDNKNILFVTQLRPGENPERPLEEEPPDRKVYEIDSIPFVLNGVGFTENRVGHLCKMNVENGKLALIEAIGGNIQSFELSPDRKKIAVITIEDQQRRPRWNSLYIADLESGEKTRIGDDQISIYHCLWASNSELYLLITDFEKGFPTNPYFCFASIESEEMKVLCRDLDLYFGNAINSDVRGVPGKTMRVSDGKLFSVVTAGPDSMIISLDNNGRVENILLSDGSIDCFDINDSGDLLYTKMTSRAPLEIYSQRKGRTKKLTHFNSWLNKCTLSIPEGFKVTASDGVQLDGWIMKPADFVEGKKYPAVLEIHGGPKTAYGNGYMHEFQLLSATGYVVIFCNPRGSAGYGTDFADIRGHYGERDFEDIMEIIQYVLNEYDFVDEERLGVTGGSYGGFMTNWIIGHTDAFKAAVSQRSISNWVSFFGTTDIGYYFAPDQIGEDFFENLEGYLRQSPLTYAPNVETPTLFIHSLEDYRCWVPEAMQLFTALKYLGKETKMILFPGETHELSRSGLPIHREKRLKAMLDWFNSYLCQSTEE